MGYNILQKGVCHIPNETKHLLVKIDMKQNFETKKTVNNFVSENEDIDFVCYMINKSKKVSDTICYQNLIGHGISLSNKCNEMHIDFENLESDLHCMMFCLCIFEPKKGYEHLGTISETMLCVENVIIHLYDEETNKEIGHYILTHQTDSTAVYLGNLEKTYKGWNFRAIEENLNGDIVGIKKILTNSQHLNKLFSKK